MKFLALGLLMFPQAGQQPNNTAANAYMPPPLACYVRSSDGEKWIKADGSICRSQIISIGNGSGYDKELFSVPRSWTCTVVNDDPKDNTMVGVVCTKPKKKCSDQPASLHPIPCDSNGNQLPECKGSNHENCWYTGKNK